MEIFFEGKPQKKPFADFVIADYHDYLPVLGVSQPPSSVPSWNEQVQGFLRFTIGFCGGFLHDDGALLLFYPESLQIKKELFAFFQKNNLKEMEESTLINSLHLCHPLKASKLVCSYPFQFP